MRQIEERYISLLTDFGFKRIFGTKPNKDLLINFLNSLFDGAQVIKDVKYLNSEHVGDVYAYCENEQGENFSVEIQNAFLKYEVGLLDKKTHKVFNDKLTFKYVEIAKFNKSEDELVTLYDKWLYVLKNLSHLDKRPAALKEKIFSKLFAEAEIAKFTKTELREYEDSLKAYRDIKNSLDTAMEQGFEKGRAEGAINIAKKMLNAGMSIDTIVDMTGLKKEDIENLK